MRERRRVNPLTMVGLALVVMITTVSCEDDDYRPPSVHGLETEGGSVYANITGTSRYNDESDTEESAHWMVSADGGMTWAPVPGRPVDDDPPRDRPSSGAGDPYVSDEACRSDGWCFRSQGRVVEQRSPSGDWTTSFALSWDQHHLWKYRSLAYQAVYRGYRPLTPVIVPVATGGATDEYVMVPVGPEGVLVLDGQHRWHRRAVGHIAPTDLSGTYVLFWLGEPMIPIMGIIALVWVPIRAAQRGGVRGGSKFLVGLGAVAIGLGIWVVTVIVWIIGWMDRADPVNQGALLIILSLLVLLMPLGFIRLLHGPRRKDGPHCLHEPALRLSDLPPPPAEWS